MAARLRLVRVRGVLGRGALTETLLADVEASGAAGPFAAVVKRLHPSLVDDRGAVARVAEEARVLARLRHPRIPALLGVGDDDGLPFFAQARVDGAPLVQAVTLPWQEVVLLLADVADALAVAHAAGVIHRDVGRQNVLVDVAGRGWLVDFGVARADDRARRTASGAVIGTPAAMAPEQARGEAVTAAIDRWALGVLGMTLMGAGHPLAIDDDDPPAVRLAKVRSDRLDDGALARLDALAPPSLAALMRHCLAAHPEDRPRDSAALAATLSALAAPLEVAKLRASLGARVVTAKNAGPATTGETLDDAVPIKGREDRPTPPFRPGRPAHPAGAARPGRRRR